MTNYVILTNGRSGSSLLNSYLTQLGAGKPQTWLDPKFYENPTLDAIQVFLESKRKNGILGVKISWWYIFQICDPLNIKFKTLLDTCLPDAKFIYLTRRDRVHQALSRTKHDMLKQSHVQNDEKRREYDELEKSIETTAVPIKEIKVQMLANAYSHTASEILFSEYNIEPYRLHFEDFIADTAGTCRKLLAFLGVTYPDKPLKDEYESTHSQINDKWHKGMLKERLAIL